MQNLRDKLLKAGLVTEKQVTEAEKKKQEPPPRPPARPQPKALSVEEQQARDAFAARETELADERRRDAAKKAEARLQSERAHQIKALVEAHRLREPPGEVGFHFVKRKGKIGRLNVSPETARMLEAGTAAVVEDPGQPEPAVLPGSAAAKVYAVDPRAIRFWAGPEKPIGFDDPVTTEESEGLEA